MGSEILASSCKTHKSEEINIRKISISDQTKGFQNTKMKSDSIVVDMEIFTQQADKDITANSRINLQRSFSRKGSQRGCEKKMNSGTGSERDNSVISTSSPRGALGGGSTPEKSMVVSVGGTNNQISPQVQHSITIMTGNINGGGGTTTTTESKWGGGKRSSFKRTSSSGTIDPRRILLFFATLSSMGTILLIYLTLSVDKRGGDDNALDW